MQVHPPIGYHKRAILSICAHKFSETLGMARESWRFDAAMSCLGKPRKVVLASEQAELPAMLSTVRTVPYAVSLCNEDTPL